MDIPKETDMYLRKVLGTYITMMDGRKVLRRQNFVHNGFKLFLKWHLNLYIVKTKTFIEATVLVKWSFFTETG